MAIVCKRAVDLLADDTNENDKAQKNVAFKNKAPFRLCILKINSILIDNAEDLDIVMPMYNLLEYIQITLCHQEVYGIIAELKLMTLMLMLQMVNHLNIKQKKCENNQKVLNDRYNNRKVQMGPNHHNQRYQL